MLTGKAIPGFDGAPRHPHWRLGSWHEQARQVISQLEHESNQRDAQAFTMAELLFGQLVTHLKRHRYATDTLGDVERNAAG
jgi:AraC family L-rhamnose operon transcriptional activator RhaR